MPRLRLRAECAAGKSIVHGCEEESSVYCFHHSFRFDKPWSASGHTLYKSMRFIKGRMEEQVSSQANGFINCYSSSKILNSMPLTKWCSHMKRNE